MTCALSASRRSGGMMSMLSSLTLARLPASSAAMRGRRSRRSVLAASSVCAAYGFDASARVEGELERDMTPSVKWRRRAGMTMVGSSPGIAGEAARRAFVNAEREARSAGM